MSEFRSLIAVALACWLAAGPVGAQQPRLPQRLRIIPLEGQNAVNYIPIRTATAPVVEVRDENDRPVEGAAVEFRVVSLGNGAGATFQGGQTSQKSTTDFRGQAGAAGYSINEKPGKFQIDITATSLDRMGRFVMTQSNSLTKLPPEIGGPERRSRLKWVLLGVAAGAGVGLGVYFGTRNGNAGPIMVGTGPVVIGGPR